MKIRSGLTVVEVIACLAAVGILCALFLPLLQVHRENARSIQCANNLKQFGLGIHNYHDTFKVLPPAGTTGTHSPLISWQVRITPFTEQVQLYDRINMRAVDAVASIIPMPKQPNALAESHQVPYAMCPNDPSEEHVPGWSTLGTKESGLRIQEGGVSGLAAQSSYCGNLGAQLTSSEAGSRATACDQYNTGSAGRELGNFDSHMGATPHGFDGAKLNTVETANECRKVSKRQISGLFSENLFGPITLADIKDGTSNTFMAGEVLSMCTGAKTRLGWWHFQDYSNARASVSVPLNTYSTCVETEALAKERKYLYPDCAPIAHGMAQQSASNITWGFRSWHPGGANILMADGSVQFFNENMDYDIYWAYGGRDDGRVVE